MSLKSIEWKRDNMVTVGSNAAHELYAHSELLDHLRLCEEAGFSTAMCSDHFYPWTPNQGHSGHSFTRLAAALARTRMSIGTICYPCGRYHPAVLAQTAVTSLGITAIHLHNIGDDQERFIRFYAERVIPQLSLDLIPS